MGILNVTPDSFSDGGQFFDHQLALRRAREMVAAGADIVDVGGESTRPGAEAVSVDEELERVLPVVKQLAAETDSLISVDTMKAAVAAQAVAAGAHMINDVSAMTHDGAMLEVAAQSGAGVILMHMQGTPRVMQDNPCYTDAVLDIKDYLAERIEACCAAGIERECLAIDPGIGFGKTVRHNLELLAGLPAFAELHRPVLVGLSRKSFLGKITGREVQDRLPASLAATAYSIVRGAHIMRVHDVKESCDSVRVVDMLMAEEHGDVGIESNTHTQR
jgi:dihydropteroate synthase